jgi:hypothetical protein
MITMVYGISRGPYVKQFQFELSGIVIIGSIRILIRVKHEDVTL